MGNPGTSPVQPAISIARLAIAQFRASRTPALRYRREESGAAGDSNRFRMIFSMDFDTYVAASSPVWAGNTDSYTGQTR